MLLRMSSIGWIVALSIAQALTMLASLEAGFRAGMRAPRMPQPDEGLRAMEAALFALMGLMLGFAFAGAVSRLDARRELIVREANAIGTAYLRVDLLPAAVQPELRQLFRRYLEARLRVYTELADPPPARRAASEAVDLQQRIWQAVIAARGADPTGDAARVVVPALNEMIDVTTARTVAQQTRLPLPILGLLLALAVLSAFVAGYAMAARGRRSLVHMVLYAVAVSLTTYIVFDLDNPRIGLIRLDAAEQALRQLHDSIR